MIWSCKVVWFAIRTTDLLIENKMWKTKLGSTLFSFIQTPFKSNIVSSMIAYNSQWMPNIKSPSLFLLNKITLLICFAETGQSNFPVSDTWYVIWWQILTILGLAIYGLGESVTWYMGLQRSIFWFRRLWAGVLINRVANGCAQKLSNRAILLTGFWPEVK